MALKLPHEGDTAWAAEHLAAEVRAYNAARDLQGTALPLLVAHGTLEQSAPGTGVMGGQSAAALPFVCHCHLGPGNSHTPLCCIPTLFLDWCWAHLCQCQGGAPPSWP